MTTMARLEREMPEAAAQGDLANSFLFIGELAKKTGTDPKTIRFYERADLLSPPRHGRFRTYLATDVQRLKNVLMLRKMGVPIAQIRELLAAAGDTPDVLATPRAATALETHLQTLSERQREVAEQISQTERAIARLSV
jgi:DNA-binding transcriptional MerR regulator